MGAKLNMDTGGEIINCAAKLFAKRGVGSVSLRDIADELGISKGTLHYYFKTKEDLICSCAENCVAVIGDGVFELMNGAARGGSAESVCERFVSAFFDDASLPKLLVGLLCCECGRAAEICRSAIEEWRVMFEVAALRLSPRSGGQTELSQAAIPIILGFAAAQAEPQAAQKAATEALAALILKK